jgi:hypothetical protein
MQCPDLVERSLLPRLHETPEMPSCQGNAAVEPSHCMKHDRVAKDLSIPSVVPSTVRSAEHDGPVVATVRGCCMTSPLGPIPIAVLVRSLRVSIPPDYRLTIHRPSLPPAQSRGIPDRRERVRYPPGRILGCLLGANVADRHVGDSRAGPCPVLVAA